jgi:hypothetical protein
MGEGGEGYVDALLRGLQANTQEDVVERSCSM